LYQTVGFGLIHGPLVRVEDSPETPRAAPAAVEKEWKRRGCFKQAPMSPRERNLKADNARLWLQVALHDGPRTAVEVLRMARQAGLSIRGVRRAKRRLGVQSVKRGGRWNGWGAQWHWQFPTEAA